MRTERILSAVLIIIGMIFLGIATDGYQAFTLEQKRVTTLEKKTPSIRISKSSIIKVELIHLIRSKENIY